MSAFLPLSSENPYEARRELRELLLAKKAEALAGGFISWEMLEDTVVTREEMAKAGEWKEEHDGFYRVGSPTRIHMLAIRISVLEKRVEQQRLVLKLAQEAVDRMQPLLAEAKAEMTELAK